MYKLNIEKKREGPFPLVLSNALFLSGGFCISFWDRLVCIDDARVPDREGILVRLSVEFPKRVAFGVPSGPHDALGSCREVFKPFFVFQGEKVVGSGGEGFKEGGRLGLSLWRVSSLGNRTVDAGCHFRLHKCPSS